MISNVVARREAKIASIIEAAWTIAAEVGIAGVSLHALARAVGMRQPSLYEYFDSKHALYDAMFQDGNRQLLARIDEYDLPRDPRAALKAFLSLFVSFSLDDPARYELLFQRHLPNFTPSEESMVMAGEVLGRLDPLLHAAGVHSQGDIDCIVAITAGLIEAQLSNDPGGTRWTRHLNRLVDFYLDDVLRRKAKKK